MFANILCAVDFSPPSAHGLRVAAKLAHDLRARLEVLHVWHVPPIVYAGAPAELDGWLADATKSVETAAADARALGAGEVRSRVLRGEVASEIVWAVNDGGHGLVVLGSHGRTGVARFLLGSVAERVVRDAPCSVLVDRASASSGFRHALCAIDFSVASESIVRRTVELLPAGARVTLVHVVEPTETQADATARLATFASQLRALHKLEVGPRLLHGHPATALLEAIEADRTIDVAVVGTHGLEGVRRLLAGAVAEKIVRHSPVSVLVAR